MLRKKESAKPQKEKKVRVVKENTHKKSVVVLWVLLIGSLAFGIYKNFTAVNTHTVVKKETVRETVQDTNAVETFVRGFVWNYYTWDNNREGLQKWQESLSKYMTDDLQKLNVSIMPSGLTTSSKVSGVDIWTVEQAGSNEYKVTYSVSQEVTDAKEEQQTGGTYTVRVHKDDGGNMVIVQNPYMCSAPGVSSYKPKVAAAGNLGNKQKEITAFLDTFFKMYPTATENELKFYVANNALPCVDMEQYQYDKLDDVSLDEGKGDTVKADVKVAYLNTVTKQRQVFEYALVLKKGDNWKIIKDGF